MDQVATFSPHETAARTGGLGPPRILKPFDAREAVPLPIAAAKIARKSERTLRNWCVEHGLGRRIGGRWSVSRVALAMYLDGNESALAEYHCGARAHSETVAVYYRRLGFDDLLKRPEFGAGRE